jgi:hypothetical protein
MLTTIFELLGTGLKLLEAREENYPARTRLKIQREMNELHQTYRTEMGKPRGSRNDAVLDNVEFELRKLAAEFSAFAQGSDVKPSA